MKKMFAPTIIILAIGLAMVLLGSIFQGIQWGAGFNGVILAQAMVNIGYIATMLSGVVLTGIAVAGAVRNPDDK